MNRFRNCIVLIIALFLSIPSLCHAADGKKDKDKDKYSFVITGRVKEAVGKTDLTDAVVILYDGNGNRMDSV